VTLPVDSPLLADLNPAQREAVATTEGPLLIVAGAGSGKTRVLTHRIAYLIRESGVSPFEILALTFTNKAADEMKARVEALVGRVVKAMWVSTFHSACVRILRREAPRLGFRSSFSIYDEADSVRLVKACLAELNLDERQFPPRSLRAVISSAKAELVDFESFAARGSGRYHETVAEVYRLYQQRLLAASAMDYDDLLMVTLELFGAFPEVERVYQDRFRYLLVDEYQDTNRAQYLLTKALAAGHHNLCVVGDADQSIYAFRGADSRNILDFEKDYPEARTIVLEQNYRSTQHILEAANAVISNNPARIPKHLWTDVGSGDLLVRFEADDEHAEAEFVAAEIEELSSRNILRSQVAVFYRTNAQSRVLEEVFVRRGLAYQVVGGTKFYERREIKDVMAYLRLVVNPDDAVALRRVLNVPKRGLGDTSVGHLERFAQSRGLSLAAALVEVDSIPELGSRAVAQFGGFLDTLDLLRHKAEGGPQLALEAVLTETGYLTSIEAERTIEALGRVENLKELVTVAGEFEAANAGTIDVEGVGWEARPGVEQLEAFLQSVSLFGETDGLEDEEGAVTLMTLHNAKGLEYPVVFMVGLEEGVFPHHRALGEPGELEEERRLCYVGITRAMQRLYLISAASRNLWGVPGFNSVSRFVTEIPTQLMRTAERRELPTSSTRSSTLTRVVVGDEVRHAHWGIGRVVEVFGSGPGAEVVVDFNGLGSKHLVLAWAPLSKV